MRLGLDKGQAALGTLECGRLRGNVRSPSSRGKADISIVVTGVTVQTVVAVIIMGRAAVVRVVVVNVVAVAVVATAKERQLDGDLSLGQAGLGDTLHRRSVPTGGKSCQQ